MTQEELRGYIRRRLGEPAINVEIFDDQLNDCINEAVDMFYERHYDGTNGGMYILTLEAGKTEYTLPTNIAEVLSIMSQTDFLNDENLLLNGPDSLLTSNEIYTAIDVVSIELWYQQRDVSLDVMKTDVLFDFNNTSKILRLYAPPAETKDCALMVFANPDPESIYNNVWLKKYCVALAGIQWAVNISKYGGAMLPGGVSLNYDIINDRYTSQVESLEEELDTTYNEPVDMMIG